jgi:hypothetical protein
MTCVLHSRRNAAFDRGSSSFTCPRSCIKQANEMGTSLVRNPGVIEVMYDHQSQTTLHPPHAFRLMAQGGVPA